MKKRKIIIWAIIFAIIAAFILYKVLSKKGEELVVRSYVIENHVVENTVTATGTIEPLEQVEVGTQVSGEIDKIFVDFNSVVTKGQILAELDKSTLLENVRQAEASVRSAESELEYSKTSYERTKQLFDAKAATQISYDEARNSLVKAETSLQNAKSNFDKAKVNLGYAEIYSPIDGIVLSREVEKGQTVAASFSTPTLFTIANDLTQMKVETNVDEADIGQVKEGQKVTFTVDAYIEDVFEGVVEQIRLQPVTTNNVVTYTVIINAPNPHQKLFPGMTASVTIVTEEQTGLAIPSEALNFTPSEKVMSAMRKDMKKDIKKNMPKGLRPEPPRDMKPSDKQPDMREMNNNREVVWIMENGIMRPQPIKTGMSDGVYRIVESGLEEGDSIVLSANYVVKMNNRQKSGSNPFMPTPPGRRNNNSGNNGRSGQNAPNK